MTTVSRRDLQSLIWADTLANVARDLDLTVYSLTKICAEHAIPRPSVAEWAAVREGKASSIADFQPSFEGEDHPIVLHSTLEALPDTLAQRLAIPPKRMHRAVAEVCRVNDGWGQKSISHSGLREARSKSSIVPRRNRFASHLLTAAERLGAVGGTSHGMYVVKFEDAAVEFLVTERLHMVKVPHSRRDIELYGHLYSSGHSTHWEPTGRLVCEVKSYFAGQLVWEDKGDALLEELVPSIAWQLKIASGRIAEHEREAAAREARYQAVREERARDLERRRLDDARWLHFRGLAATWHETDHLRRFIAEVRRALDDATEETSTEPVSNWLDWAEARVLSIDPLGAGPLSLLKTIADAK